MKYLSSLIFVLKGLWIGGTMTVPGVSGGSMAMILDIYDKMISAINGVFRRPWESLVFLAKVGVGALVGIALFSRVMLHLLTTYPMPTCYFFMGAILGGLPMILKSAQITRFRLSYLLCLVIGILLVLLIGQLPEGLFAADLSQGISAVLLQVLAGVIIAVALVLPGISGSQMLLMLGMYQPVMTAISNFDLLALIPVAIGGLSGTLLSARLIEKAFERFPQATYLFIFGFILGSIPEIYPGVPSGGLLLLCPVMAVLGFLAIYGVSRLEDQKAKK